LRTVIIANGPLNKSIKLSADDVLIAADGGARHCIKYGLHPDYVVGDFDSLSEKDLNILNAWGAKIIRHPARKNFSDLELALQRANSLGSDEVLIYAALGARWDQTIANILLPTIFPSLRISLIDGSQEMYFLRGGEHLDLYGNPGDLISLIPLIGNVYGISTRGLEYKLEDENLWIGHTRGISNVLMGDTATINSKEGLLLCVMIRV
jgi:thiamine pyrophosphokinase